MSVRREVPWLVFFGTHTALVWATGKVNAYTAFIDARFPQCGGKKGQLVAPGFDEVRIRELSEADREWIEDSEDAQFLAALKALAKSSVGDER